MIRWQNVAAAVAAFSAAISSITPSAANEIEQSSESIPYQGVIEANHDGRRTQLEVQSAPVPRLNAGIMTLGSGQMFYEIKGPASPVRIPRGSNFHFVTRSMGEGADPAMFFKLYSAESKKKGRRIKISHSSFSQRMTIDMDRSAVPLRYEVGKDGLVKIYTVAPLAPGEYAFLLEGRAFAFGID